MDQLPTLSRDEGAMELATTMANSDDTMRTILGETLLSASMGRIREAGRTKCPENGEIRGPLERFPRAINLAPCPREKGGTWHVHVTEDEIRYPTNSLPDMSNVIFGLTDVSIVVGTQTADIIVAPENRKAAIGEFQNAIGSEVYEPRDVTAAIRAGRIMPAAARERVRDRMPELFYQIQTGYSDLDQTVRELPDDVWETPPASGGEEAVAGNGTASMAFAPQSIEAAADSAEQVIGNAGLANLVVSQALGTIVGNVVDSFFFNN